MHLRVKRSLHASNCKLYYYLDSRGEIRKTILVSSPASVSAACRRKQDRRLVSAGYTWMQHDHTRQTNPTFCQIFHARLSQHFAKYFTPNASRWPCLPFRPRLLRCLRALVSPCGRCSTPSWHNRFHLRELLAFSLRRPQTRCATPMSTRCDRFHMAETDPFYPLKPPNYGVWTAAPFNVKTKRSC